MAPKDIDPWGHLVLLRARRLTLLMLFWGLASWEIREVIEFFTSYAEAKLALEEIIRDEPSFADSFGLVAIDFRSFEPRVTYL